MNSIWLPNHTQYQCAFTWDTSLRPPATIIVYMRWHSVDCGLESILWTQPPLVYPRDPEPAMKDTSVPNNLF